MNRTAVARELLAIAKELLAEDKLRVFYIGGGSSAVTGVTPELAAKLEATFPRTFKKKRREGNTFTYYIAERMSRKVQEWLKQNRIESGGSPMWDLAPGEMPSW